MQKPETQNEEALHFLADLESRLDGDFMHPLAEQRRCIAAVSGGPDSMALLDLLVRYGYAPVVCHVNYHKRQSAVRDEEIVRSYCEAHGLEMVLLEPVYEKGNFQGWARDVRLDFFEKTAREQGVDTIFVAHQLDDVLETYFLQKKRNILCTFFGLQNLTVKSNLRYIRPLLRLSKKELETYCTLFQVPWGLDESNLSDVYARNRIRHHCLASMTPADKEALLEEIRRENEALALRRAHAARQIETQPASVWLQDGDAAFLLEYWFFLQTGAHLSMAMAQEMVRQLQQPREVPCKNWYMERYGQDLYIHEKKELEVQPMVIHSLKELQACMDKNIQSGPLQFRLQHEGRTIESVHVTPDDFPLMLEPYQAKDTIALRYGTKKVSRIYIDQKIPHFVRRTRLLLRNVQGQVIFVPGTGCDRTHFSPNPSFYMVEF